MPTSTRFRIRIVYGVSIAFPPVEGMAFDILDVTNNLLCPYNYGGVSLSLSSPVAVNTRGPWNDFTTQPPMDVSGFGGVLRFVGVGVGSHALISLEITPLGRRSISVTPFSTGVTLGASAGAGGGALTMMFPPVPAARAPWPHTV